MRKLVIVSVALVMTITLIILIIYLKSFDSGSDSSKLSESIQTKALQVTRAYLEGQYEFVYEQLSEASFDRRGNKELSIRAATKYRTQGLWVRHLRPTDVSSAQIVSYSPEAKAFLICLMFIIDHPDVRKLEDYLRNRGKSQVPNDLLNRYVLVEVVVGAHCFLQVWRLDSDGQWRLLGWPLDGNPEVVESFLRMMKREGITP